MGKRKAPNATEIPRAWLEYKQKTLENPLVIVTQDELHAKIVTLDQKCVQLDKDIPLLIGKALKSAEKEKRNVTDEINRVVDEYYYVGPPRFVKGIVYEEDLEQDSRSVIFK